MNSESNRQYATELLGRKDLSEDTRELRFSFPAGFSFTPGQFIRFENHDLKRDYSITTAPNDKVIELCVRDTGTGNFSSVLSSAQIGTRFRFSGPHGYFVYRPSTRPVVLVATGTGVAPFVSMTRSGISGYIFLHGVKHTPDLYYENLFRKAARIYVPCVSRSADEAESDIFQGKATDYVETVLERRPYDFYLCGKREMIRDVTFLVDDYFPGSRIYTEVFY
ncbi:MAG: ferredoxin--NADP reductase [Thermodesulfobacteriota bacterium]